LEYFSLTWGLEKQNEREERMQKTIIFKKSPFFQRRDFNSFSKMNEYGK
jgi:hypothetical protein